MANNFKQALQDIWGQSTEDLVSQGGKNFGNFGLNQNARFTSIKYTETAGKDGAPGKALIYAIKVGEHEYQTRIFFSPEVYENNILISPGTPGYMEAFVKTYAQNGGVLKHIMKTLGVAEASIDAIPMQPITSEEQLVDSFIQKVQQTLTLLPSNYREIPIDVFLQHQWTLRGEAKMTYLEVPRNMKGGYFLAPHMPGKFEQFTNEDSGLMYYINENGVEHIFTRSKNYMESQHAKQQFKDNVNPNDPNTSPIAQAAASSW